MLFAQSEARNLDFTGLAPGDPDLFSEGKV